VYDSLGNPETATVRFTRTGPDAWSWAVTAPATSTGTGTLTFNPATGQIASTTGGAITVPGGVGASTINMTLDLTKLTMLSTPTSAAITSQNGLAAGSIVDAFITSGDGAVNLVYSNGMHEVVGQIAVARFTNPSGLMRAGQTSFTQGLNSGEPQIGTASTGGRGSMAAGYLEGSNVDMAQEFTNMILAQRGFQASSRVITTSDEIIQELVNLKR
jgi:flagellar hook protein FlgE